MLNLGKLLNPIEFEKYIDETDTFQEVIHKYGTEFNIPDYPCWMTYTGNDGMVGSISFTRNTIKNPVLQEMIETVVKVIDDITISSFTPDPKRVHFIKTVGNILPHRDEAGRMCCINIGIKNSNSAITKISNTNTNIDFYSNSTDYVIEDGVGFLVNTNNIHAVEGNSNIARYLITYGFGRKFEDVRAIFK